MKFNKVKIGVPKYLHAAHGTHLRGRIYVKPCNERTN